MDQIPEREVIDVTGNQYGEKFEEFLISSKCCVLNGRNRICTLNDFTSISSKGLAVVDYCIVPYGNLDTFSDFEVRHTR